MDWTTDIFKRFGLVTVLVLILFRYPTETNVPNEVHGLQEESQDFKKALPQEEEFYQWSVWSPCSRTCGIGVQFKGQICLRKYKALCVEKPIIYQTCNTQACPSGGASFRDLQCGIYNDRNIFINGHRAKWVSYLRGGHPCLLFCYPQGEELFYYFGKAKDGTQCSKETRGVCIRGRCKPVGCDNVLESGVYLDKCRLCGGNSTTCEPISGRIERPPNHFEKMSGYAEILVIPKGSTSVFLSDESWNYLAIKRQNGDYVFNGHRIINWSGLYKVGDVEVQYTKFSNNIKETIQIPGPTEEDIYITSLLITGKLNTSFEYWIPINNTKKTQDAPEIASFLQGNRLDLFMEWGSWTSCSATCGGGIKVRARTRGSAVSSFGGRETDVLRCNVVPCDKMGGQWSEWGPWDDCSASCGGGARMRFRNCKKRSQSVESSSCPGDRYAVELCNSKECPTEETRPNRSAILVKETPSSSLTAKTRNSTATSNEINPISSFTAREKILDSRKMTQARPISSSFLTVFQSFNVVSVSKYLNSFTSSKLQLWKETVSLLKDGVSQSEYRLGSSPKPDILHSSPNPFLVSSKKVSRTAYGSHTSAAQQGTLALLSEPQSIRAEWSVPNERTSQSFPSYERKVYSSAGAKRDHILAEIPVVTYTEQSETGAVSVVTKPSFTFTESDFAIKTPLTYLTANVRSNITSPITTVTDTGSRERSQTATHESRKMTNSIGIPSSPAVQSFERSLGLFTSDLAVPVESRSYLLLSSIPSQRNVTPGAFTTMEPEVEGKRKKTNFSIEEGGFPSGSIHFSSSIEAPSKQVYVSNRQKENSKFTSVFSEGLDTMRGSISEGIHATNSALPLEITSIVDVFGSILSLPLTTNERLKSSTDYSPLSNYRSISDHKMSRSLSPPVSSGLPVATTTLIKRTYSSQSESSLRPSSSFKLPSTTLKTPTPLIQTTSSLSSTRLNENSLLAANIRFKSIPLTLSSYFSPFTTSQYSRKRNRDIGSRHTSISSLSLQMPSSIKAKDTSNTSLKNLTSTMHLFQPSSVIQNEPLPQTATPFKALQNHRGPTLPYPQLISTTRKAKANRTQSRESSSLRSHSGPFSSPGITLAPREGELITLKNFLIKHTSRTCTLSILSHIESVMKQGAVTNEIRKEGSTFRNAPTGLSSQERDIISSSPYLIIVTSSSSGHHTPSMYSRTSSVRSEDVISKRKDKFPLYYSLVSKTSLQVSLVTGSVSINQHLASPRLSSNSRLTGQRASMMFSTLSWMNFHPQVATKTSKSELQTLLGSLPKKHFLKSAPRQLSLEATVLFSSTVSSANSRPSGEASTNNVNTLTSSSTRNETKNNWQHLQYITTPERLITSNITPLLSSLATENIMSRNAVFLRMQSSFSSPQFHRKAVQPARMETPRDTKEATISRQAPVETSLRHTASSLSSFNSGSLPIEKDLPSPKIYLASTSLIKPTLSLTYFTKTVSSQNLKSNSVTPDGSLKLRNGLYIAERSFITSSLYLEKSISQFVASVSRSPASTNVNQPFITFLTLRDTNHEPLRAMVKTSSPTPWLTNGKLVTSSSAMVDAPSSSVLEERLKLVSQSMHSTTVNKTAVSASTVLGEEKPQCPPCDLHPRLREKYCHSDYAILFRVRSEGIVHGSQTLYLVYLKKVFKKNQRMRKKLEIRLSNDIACNCKPKLLLKKEYLVLGNHNVSSMKISNLELDRQSFVAKWDVTLENQMKQIQGNCFRNLFSTPRPDYSSHIKETSMTTAGVGPTKEALPFTTQSIAEAGRESPTTQTTPNRPVKCRSCRLSKKRNKSFCESDFVVRARIVQSSFDGRTQERKYLVKVITVFRRLVEIKTVQEIFVQRDFCQCPKLLPQKQYVLMGTAEQISVSEHRLLIPRKPFVKIWKSRMDARLKSISDICDS